MVSTQNNPLQQAERPPRQSVPLVAQSGPGSGSEVPVPHVPSYVTNELVRVQIASWQRTYTGIFIYTVTVRAVRAVAAVRVTHTGLTVCHARAGTAFALDLYLDDERKNTRVKRGVHRVQRSPCT